MAGIKKRIMDMAGRFLASIPCIPSIPVKYLLERDIKTGMKGMRGIKKRVMDYVTKNDPD
jgi:hypothetical protein